MSQYIEQAIDSNFPENVENIITETWYKENVILVTRKL